MHSVTRDTFTASVLEAELPVVVDFTAAWCPPCRAMEPVLAGLEHERDDVRFAQVDVDAEPEIAARYGVLSMPTFVVFRGGTPVARLVGARPKRRLAAEIDAALTAAPVA